MRVKEVMTPRIEVIDPDSTLQEAAARLKARDIGPLPVCDNGRLLGMLTDRDITVRATAEGEDPTVIRVRDLMTPEVLFCFEDQLVGEASRLMQDNQVRRLLVLNRDRQVVGIVSLADLAVETGDAELVGQTLEQVSVPDPPRG
jgi:CBS domain-containing protein